MKKIHLDYQLYIQRENRFFHQPYRNEVDFYDAICNGDLEYIEKCKQDFEDVRQEFTTMEGKGVLSSDPVRNERYHFIVNAAVITRKCIDAGMLQEDAYTLSDLYIRTVDGEETVAGIQELNDQMVREFAGKMRQMLVGKVGSKHISKIIQYIYDHLHEKITPGEYKKVCAPGQPEKEP